MSTTPSRNHVARGLPRNPRPGQAAPFPSRAPAPGPAADPAPQAQRLREKRSMPSMDSSRSQLPEASERSRLQTLRQKKSFHSTQRHHVSRSTSSQVLSSDTASLRSSSSESSTSSSSSDTSARTSVTSFSDVDTAENGEGPGAKTIWHGHSYSVDGTSVWKSVAGVANLVSQEVNKVWATGITPLSANSNDADESRHLLDTMRRYHLSKTPNPMDLPEWLFSERERGVRGQPAEPSKPSNSREKPIDRGVPSSWGSAPKSQSSGREARLPTGTGSASDRLRAKRSIHRMATKG